MAFNAEKIKIFFISSHSDVLILLINAKIITMSSQSPIFIFSVVPEIFDW